MAKVAFFVSHAEMLEQTRTAAEKENISDVEIRLIETANSVKEARAAAANGACVIVARGRQASLIKRETDLPVVEITLTGQEIALLLSHAQKMVDFSQPTVAFIGFPNMFSNLNHFGEIFNMKLLSCFIETADEVDLAVTQARKNGADVMIGGDAVCACAQRLGIPHLFLSSTEDSAREAFRVVKSVLYMHDMEQSHTVQFKALLDYSFNGILKTDSAGSILICNHIIEEILGRQSAELLGLPLSCVIPALKPAILQLFTSGKELYSEFMTVNNAALAVNLVPIKIDGNIDGAILSCHEIQKLKSMEESLRLELYKNNHRAKFEFHRLTAKSDCMKHAIDLAKLYAQTKSPVLITGEPGTERGSIAQSIHNAGERKNQPYVSVSCACIPPEQQLHLLFDQSGVIDSARGGTLFLEELEHLEPVCQNLLLRLLRDGLIQSSDCAQLTPVDVRIIAACTTDLLRLVKSGMFLEQLYYVLCSLNLTIPPLRQRPEDLEDLLDATLKHHCSLYYRYITLSKPARKRLLQYRWNGNLPQLEGFCERLVLTATHRMVDETFVENLFSTLYPITGRISLTEPLVVYKSPEAAELAQLLEKHGGNRDLAAKELNISKTTLWRRMKKYGVVHKYDV